MKSQAEREQEKAQDREFFEERFTKKLKEKMQEKSKTGSLSKEDVDKVSELLIETFVEKVNNKGITGDQKLELINYMASNAAEWSNPIGTEIDQLEASLLTELFRMVQENQQNMSPGEKIRVALETALKEPEAMLNKQSRLVDMMIAKYNSLDKYSIIEVCANMDEMLVTKGTLATFEKRVANEKVTEKLDEEFAKAKKDAIEKLNEEIAKAKAVLLEYMKTKSPSTKELIKEIGSLESKELEQRSEKIKNINKMLKSVIKNSGLEGKSDKVTAVIRPLLEEHYSKVFEKPGYNKDELAVAMAEFLKESAHTSLLTSEKTITTERLNKLAKMMEEKFNPQEKSTTEKNASSRNSFNFKNITGMMRKLSISSEEKNPEVTNQTKDLPNNKRNSGRSSKGI